MMAGFRSDYKFQSHSSKGLKFVLNEQRIEKEDFSKATRIQASLSFRG